MELRKSPRLSTGPNFYHCQMQAINRIRLRKRGISLVQLTTEDLGSTSLSRTLRGEWVKSAERRRGFSEIVRFEYESTLERYEY
jgi:hypothetical protein